MPDIALQIELKNKTLVYNCVIVSCVAWWRQMASGKCVIIGSSNDLAPSSVVTGSTRVVVMRTSGPNGDDKDERDNRALIQYKYVILPV